MKIYAVVYSWVDDYEPRPIAYFKNRETAMKQIRMIRNPIKGDWAHIKEIELLEEPLDDLQVNYDEMVDPDETDFQYYYEDGR